MKFLIKKRKHTILTLVEEKDKNIEEEVKFYLSKGYRVLKEYSNEDEYVKYEGV